MGTKFTLHTHVFDTIACSPQVYWISSGCQCTEGGVRWRIRSRQEPPRLHIAHHQVSRIDHTGVGEYQVTMYLRVEMINTEKEMVHVQFLVDGTPQGNPQLLGDDGQCEQILVLAPATHPHISVLLTWRHEPSPKPISLGDLHVPTRVDPREQYFFQREAIQRERRRAEERRRGQSPPVQQSGWRRVLAWFREPL